jgi:hypothetical protein
MGEEKAYGISCEVANYFAIGEFNCKLHAIKRLYPISFIFIFTFVNYVII